MLQTEA